MKHRDIFSELSKEVDVLKKMSAEFRELCPRFPFGNYRVCAQGLSTFDRIKSGRGFYGGGGSVEILR